MLPTPGFPSEKPFPSLHPREMAFLFSSAQPPKLTPGRLFLLPHSQPRLLNPRSSPDSRLPTPDFRL